MLFDGTRKQSDHHLLPGTHSQPPNASHSVVEIQEAPRRCPSRHGNKSRYRELGYILALENQVVKAYKDFSTKDDYDA